MLQCSVIDPTGRWVKFATNISWRKIMIKAASVINDVVILPALMRIKS